MLISYRSSIIYIAIHGEPIEEPDDSSTGTGTNDDANTHNHTSTKCDTFKRLSEENTHNNSPNPDPAVYTCDFGVMYSHLVNLTRSKAGIPVGTIVEIADTLMEHILPPATLHSTQYDSDVIYRELIDNGSITVFDDILKKCDKGSCMVYNNTSSGVGSFLQKYHAYSVLVNSVVVVLFASAVTAALHLSQSQITS